MTIDAAFEFDVVGVGALNLDYIATGQRPAGAAPLDWGTERAVSADVIHAALETAGAGSLEVNLGGSAFNAITAIAHTQLGRRLGYVGVAGRTPLPGRSSLRQMQVLGIDGSGVRWHADLLSGVCFAYVAEGERTLLTHAGANECMADYLEDDFEVVVTYLSAARVVHVTSFLDPRTPRRLRTALEAVRQRSPATVISFDPGHVWATNPTPDIAGILRLADFLLLNQREFESLGGQRPGDDEAGVAARLLGQARAGATILVKKPSGTTTFTRDDGRVHYAQPALAPDEIADATGAGDVFAAGLLAVIASDRRQVELGSRLGMALARHKLRHVGQSGHAQFPRIAEDLIRSQITWR